MRLLNFSDGFTSATEPLQGNITANALKVFASDADFVTDKGSVATQGDVYSRSSDDVIRYYDGSAWVSLASTAAVDSAIAVHTGDTTDAHAASAITNTPSGNLAATTVQAALNELQTDVDTRATSSALSSHESDTTSIHGITDTSLLLTTTGAQVVTAKDIDGGTASNTSRITIPKASKATLDALTRKEATVVYASDTDKLYYDDGSVLKAVGSGSGNGINYITDSDAESGTGSWATYADAAASSPVDGTGGSPSSTWTTSTSSPLRGTASFLWTKSAANRQGEGFSYDFTIDSTDQAKVLQVAFDYKVASGTYADSDMTIWIYDVTNAALIQPAGYTIKNASVSMKQLATFQSASNSTSYRLIVHTASTSASAYTLQFDNFSVGPQSVSGVIPKASTVQKFTSGSGTYTTPEGVYQIKVRMVGGGAGGSGSGTVSAGHGGSGGNTTFGTGTASGAATNTSPTSSGDGGVGGAATLGTGWAGSAITGNSGGTWQYSGTNAIFPQGGTGGGSPFGEGAKGPGYNGTGKAAPANSGAGGSGAGANEITALYGGTGGGAGGYIDAIIANPTTSYSYAIGSGGAGGTAGTSGNAGGAGGSGYIEVTEYYLGSNVQLSSDTDTRVVVAQYERTTTQSVTANTTIIDYATKVIDTHGAVTTGASWKFTAPVSGYYDISVNVYSTDATIAVVLCKNGASQFYLAGMSSSAKMSAGSQVIQLNAGDYIHLLPDTTGTISISPNINRISIKRVSGPSVIAASESVCARYTSAAGQSIANAATPIIDFGTKTYDSHGAVTTGASWKFTAPVSGTYSIQASIGFDTAVWSAFSSQIIHLYKDGVFVSATRTTTPTAATFFPSNLPLNDSIKLLAGEYIDIRGSHQESAARTLQAVGSLNYIAITRTGNY